MRLKVFISGVSQAGMTRGFGSIGQNPREHLKVPIDTSLIFDLFPTVFQIVQQEESLRQGL